MSSVLLGAAPVAASDAPFVAVCFSVQAAAEPGVMPRVLELFAKRGLVPQKWQSAVSGTVLTIDVQIGGVRPGKADFHPPRMRPNSRGGARPATQRRLT